MFSIFRTGEATAPLKTAWEEGGEALRKAILQATHAIDHLLARAPHELGESREGKVRILFSNPVAVLYEVDDAQQRVNVLRAWAYNRAPLPE
jgi:hypothetical protein